MFSMRLIMRYWLVGLSIPILVVCGMSVGIVGCTNSRKSNDKDPKADKAANIEKDAKTKDNAAKELAAKELAAKELAAKELAAKELAAKELAAKELAAIAQAAKELAAKQLASKDPIVKEPDVTETIPVTQPAVKAKEKDKTKDGKDPKKEENPGSKFPEFKEPKEVGGKSFEAWRKEIKSGDPSKREAAMKMILGFGPKRCYEIVPDLIGELKKHKAATPIDLAVRVNGLEALTRILSSSKDPSQQYLNDSLAVYKTFLNDTQIVVRLTAVRGLPNLGPTGRQAMTEVIKLCSDPVTYEVRKDAISVLIMMAPDEKGVMDPQVMPVLKKAAANDNSYLVRINAFQGITMVGRSAALRDGAIVDLRRPLSQATLDPSFQVRQTALQGLAMLGEEKALPDMRKALADSSKEVRLSAVNLLVGSRQYMQTKDEKGNKDEKGIKERGFTLKKLSDHLVTEKEPIIRLWVRGAIMVIDKIDKVHMNAIVKDFQSHEELPVRLEALKIICEFGDKGKPYTYDAVLGAIEDPEQNVAMASMVCLVQLHAYEAIPTLEKLKNNVKAPQVLRDAAEDALDAFVSLREQKKARDKDNEKDKKAPDKK